MHLHQTPASTNACRTGKAEHVYGFRAPVCGWCVFQEEHQADNALEHAALVSTRVAENLQMLAEHEGRLATQSQRIEQLSSLEGRLATQSQRIEQLSSLVANYNTTHAREISQLRAEHAERLATVERTCPQIRTMRLNRRDYPNVFACRTRGEIRNGRTHLSTNVL